MALRGQGDSPVRICEPCKKLEEAARFEMRHGHRSRTGKGTSFYFFSVFLVFRLFVVAANIC